MSGEEVGVTQAAPSPRSEPRVGWWARLPGSCCQEPAEVLGGAACCPGQGCGRQVLQGSLTLLSRTCRTSGKYKQLSDVNRDYPVGGPGPGPNICVFCPPSSVRSLVFLAVSKHSSQSTQAVGQKGLAVPTGAGNVGSEARARTWSWSPRALQGCQALCSPTGSWKLHHHAEVFR